METIKTLVEQIKNENNLRVELQSSIKKQSEKLLLKFMEGMLGEGVFCHTPALADGIEIPVGEYEKYVIKLNEQGCFTFQYPYNIQVINAEIQTKIYKVLSTFENELTDLQLDVVRKNQSEKWEEENKLTNLIAEDLFQQLVCNGDLYLTNSSYFITQGEKGRWNLTNKHGEVKSYFKAQVLKELRNDAQQKMWEYLK